MNYLRTNYVEKNLILKFVSLSLFYTARQLNQMFASLGLIFVLKHSTTTKNIHKTTFLYIHQPHKLKQF